MLHNAPPPLLVSVEEAGRSIGKGKTVTFQLLKSGALESVLIGRSRMIVYASLVKYVDGLREQAKLPKAA